MDKKLGRFIVVEGLDGSGKTTAARGLATRLGARYLTTPSEELRKQRDAIIAALPTQEARQLFYQATLHTASEEIRRLIGEGTDVVLDRYYLSTEAYAAFRGSSLDGGPVFDLLLPADITFYVDVSREIRVARMAERGMSVADQETVGEDADRRLRHEHVARSKHSLVGRFVLIGADDLGIEDLQERMLAEVSSNTRRGG